jgi:alkanesulfonate monooxygenase SsuD/methylene tetrahydromethanopterin reductase-like flavin-dependent oxidoreductase (luciferase family)
MMFGHQPTDDPAFYAEVLDQVEAADRLGYDCVWFAEHHFDNGSEFCGRLPAPMLFVAAAAQRTKRIRLGTGVRVISLHNPVIMAEEAAVADLISGGRLNLGAGQGVNPDLEKFGLSTADKHARYREMLDVMTGAWAPGTLTYHGQYFDYDDVCIIPKPIQQPRDILWVAARDEGSIMYAAEHGYSLLIGQAELTERQATYAQRYRAASLAAGHTPRVGGTRVIYVSESTEQARAEIEECIWRYFRRYSGSAYFKQALADGLLTLSDNPTVDEAMQSVSLIVGDPDSVAAELEGFCRALGVTTLTSMMHIAGMPHQLMLKSMRLFVEEVKPRLLARLGTSVEAVA